MNRLTEHLRAGIGDCQESDERCGGCWPCLIRQACDQLDTHDQALRRIAQIGDYATGLDELEECVTVAREALTDPR